MPGVFITTSASVSPQFREFERFTTACSVRVHRAEDAALREPFGGRAARRRAALGELRMMASNGGVATPAMVGEKPVMTLLSGLAAGVLGGAWIGDLSGRRQARSPSTSAAPAPTSASSSTGRFAETDARTLRSRGFPLLVPMIDIHTIGAGGGSIAYIDHGGAFRVGPRSAGAVPGPAAYGRGGKEPTVTDANVVLGRLDKDDFLGGSMKLDADAAHRAIERARQFARHEQARGGRRHAHRHQQQHGERHPLAYGAKGHRSARALRWSRSAARARCTAPKWPPCSAFGR